MKNPRTKVVRLFAITFIGLVLAACTKDIMDKIQDNFDFSLDSSNEETTYIYEAAKTEFEVEPERAVSTVEYFFSYKLIKGKGYFEYANGGLIQEGDPIPLSELSWEQNFISTEVGQNQVEITVFDTNGNTKTKQLNYIVDYAPFTFLANKGSETFIINSDNRIEVALLTETTGPSSREKAENLTYTLRYSVENGTGNFEENGVVIEQDHQLKIGETLLTYIPRTLGEHKITLTATASDGATRKEFLNVLVKHSELTFIASSSGNQTQVDTEIPLSINLRTLTNTEDVSYLLTPEIDGNGNLLSASGTELVLGQDISIMPGEHGYRFVSSNLGENNIHFTLTDSNGQIKKDSVHIEVINIPFVFTGNANNNVSPINQENDLNFNLQATGNTANIDYSLSFTITEGNGVVRTPKGVVVDNDTPIDVELGNIQLTYAPTTLGAHNLIFEVVDSYGQKSATVPIDLVAEDVALSFTSSIAQSNMIVNLENEVSVSLYEVQNLNGVTYEILHTIEGGTAELFDHNGNHVEPSVYETFIPGVTNYTFKPSLAGNYTINFTLRDSNGQILEAQENVLVQQSDFVFNASFANSSIPLGTSNNINFSLSPNSNNGTTYTIQYNGNQNGVFEYEGRIYGNGEQFQIDEGQSFASFTPETVGDYVLNFTVVDSNGTTKEDSAEMNVDNSEFSVSANANPTQIYRTGESMIGVDVSQLFDNPYATYEASINTEQQADVYLEDGTAVMIGNFFEIPTGSSNWMLKPLQLGIIEIEIVVRDNTLQQQSRNLSINVQANDFELSAVSSKATEYMNEGIGNTLNIKELAENSKDTYEAYVTSNLNGHILYGGNTYSFGQRFPVTEGNNEVLYVGREAGTHLVTYTVVSSSNIQKSASVNMEFLPIDFEFFASSDKTGLVLGEAAQLGLVINQTEHPSDYKVKYTLLSGTGIMRDASNQTLKQGAQYDVPSDNFSWSYLPNTVGTHTVQIISSNGTGIEKSVEITLSVSDKDYSLDVTPSRPSAFMGETISLSGAIKELDLGGETYTLRHTATGLGTLRYDGTQYAPGQSFTVPVGNFAMDYTGTEAGTNQITFTATSSTNKSKSVTVNLEFNTVSFDFTASTNSNNSVLGETVTLPLTITETNGSSTYRMRYSIVSGGGIVRNESNETMEQGTYYDVVTDGFNWGFDPNTTGNNTIRFTVVNATGAEQDATVSVSVSDKDYSFDVTPSRPSAFMGETISLSGAIKELDLGGETYTLRHTATGLGTLRYDGTQYAPGQSFTVPVGNFAMDYTGTEAGTNQITFTATSSTNKSKSVTVNLEFNTVSFDFTASTNSNNSVLGETVTLPLTITETNGSSTYRMRYSIVSGGGIVRNESNETMEQGTYYDVVTDGFNWGFDPNTTGNNTIRFTVVNATGAEQDATVSVSVSDKDYKFTATPASSNAFVLDEVNISAQIQELDLGGETYTLSYSGNGSGELRYNGTLYSPGQSFNVPTGSFTLTYKGLREGANSITLTATSSRGLQKSQSFTIDFDHVKYTYTATATNKAFQGETVTVNHLVNETSGNSNYQMRYSVITGNPTITDHNGSKVVAGTYIDVPTGGFSWDILSDNVENVTVLFEVTNDTGLTITDTVSINYTSFVEPFSLNVTKSNALVLKDRPLDMTANISPIGDTQNSTVYTMTFTFQNSNGGHVLYNGTTYQAGESFAVSVGNNSFQFVPNSDNDTEVTYIVSNSTGETEDDEVFYDLYLAPQITNVRTGFRQYNKRSCGNGCNWDIMFLVDFDYLLDARASSELKVKLSIYSSDTDLGRGTQELEFNVGMASTYGGYYIFYQEEFAATSHWYNFDNETYTITFIDSNQVETVVTGNFTNETNDSQ